jgi:hypothetical protein
VVNTILALANARVTNLQIEWTEDTAIIAITPGRERFTLNGILYKVLGTDNHITMETIRAAIMHSRGADDIHRALGPSRALCQATNARPNK